MELTRQFQFYDIIPIRDPQYGSPEDSLFSNPQLSSICSTPSLLIFNAGTTVKILNDKYEFVAEFECHDVSYTLFKIMSIPQSSLVVTILEKVGHPSLLTIWDLNKIVKNPGSVTRHSYHSQVEISNGDNNFPMTSVDANTDFNVLVFGFSNGSVILMRGDIVHDKGSRQRLIYQDIDPITGVFLKQELVYVTTISKILTMPTNGRTQPIVYLDKKTGAELGNSTFNYTTGNLIGANEKNVMFYNDQQKLSTLQLSYAKRRIYNLARRHNYLLVVSPVKNSATTTRLVIVDYSSKQIILNNTISASVRDVFEWKQDLYLLSNDGMLYRLVEKRVDQQLEIVMQRNLFPVLLELLHRNGMPVKEIHARYGDYLYRQQDFNEAMEQYIRCLDSDTETSEIINRFKNNQNLDNLIKYLKRMVDLQLLKDDHLTLLMCCYIKLKLKDQLASLLTQLQTDRPHFDLHTIIQLCRESQFYDILTRLALLYDEFPLVIDIQMNDLDRYDRVLAYCKTLGINDLLSVLLSPELNLVKKLLDKKPLETTDLLIQVFTGSFQKEAFDVELLEKNSAEIKSSSTSSSPHTPLNNPSHSKPTYLPPKPRLIFKSFINNEPSFVFFLESCLKSYEVFKGDPTDKSDLIVTLFEVYISLYNKTSDEDWSLKLRLLLRLHEHDIGDINQLLLLCQLNSFSLDDDFYNEESIVDLYRSCTIAQDLAKSIDILHKYGTREPLLFKLALKFYCSKDTIYDSISTEEFEYLFANIKAHNILTPLEIIEIMSLNEVPRIGVLKAMLLDHVSAIKKNVVKNDKLIRSYETENELLTKDIHELSGLPTTIQPGKCCTCHQQLKLPVVHFKCSHSYHLNCLNDMEVVGSASAVSLPLDSEYKCPLCVNELEEIESIRKQQEETADRNDLFLNVLNNESNDDNLQIISDFIGRGSLENLKYVVS